MDNWSDIYLFVTFVKYFFEVPFYPIAGLVQTMSKSVSWHRSPTRLYYLLALKSPLCYLSRGLLSKITMFAMLEDYIWRPNILPFPERNILF